MTDLKVKLRKMDATSEPLEDETLIENHKKIHKLYMNSIKKRPLHRKLINIIVEYHDNYANEIIKRNMNHITPLRKL